MTNRKNTRSLIALDWVNFCLADMQMAVGAFVAIYLAAVRHWSPGEVGGVVAAQNIATMIVQVPAGALIDRTNCKSRILAAAACVIGACSIAVLIAQTVVTEIAIQVIMGVATAIVPPAVGALSLGMVGRATLAKRVG
jgi:MFS family permease